MRTILVHGFITPFAKVAEKDRIESEVPTLMIGGL
jgi:hypothetical protein